MAVWNSFTYICTRALHSFLYFWHCRAAYIVIHLLLKASFTQSAQPNLSVPRKRPLATYFCHQHPYSHVVLTHSFLAGVLYHWCYLSTLLANSVSIPTLLRTSLFLPLSIRSWHSHQSSQTLHPKKIHFPSLSTSHTPCICSVKPRLYNYSFEIDTSLHLYPILYCLRKKNGRANIYFISTEALWCREADCKF